MEDSEMSEEKTAVGKRQRHLTFLGMIGIPVAIIGFGIFFIPGAPMRGSGLGSVATILGALMVLAELGRARRRNPKEAILSATVTSLSAHIRRAYRPIWAGRASTVLALP